MESMTLIKNCKKYENNMKKSGKNCNNCEKTCVFDINQVELFAWIKTLLSVHDVLPNIVKCIDKTINAKASSASYGSLIFGDYKNGTYGQVEEVLRLQDRKLSIINLYSMVEKMVESLPEKYQKFVSLKFYKHKKIKVVAEEFDIDERTAFRWADSVMKKLYLFCKNNNWTKLFFNSQTTCEHWLKEHYKIHYKKLCAKYKLKIVNGMEYDV